MKVRSKASRIEGEIKMRLAVSPSEVSMMHANAGVSSFLSLLHVFPFCGIP